MLFTIFDSVVSAFTLFPFVDSFRYTLIYFAYICAGLCLLLIVLLLVHALVKLNKSISYATAQLLFLVLYSMSTFLYIPFLGMSPASDIGRAPAQPLGMRAG